MANIERSILAILGTLYVYWIKSTGGAAHASHNKYFYGTEDLLIEMVEDTVK